MSRGNLVWIDLEMTGLEPEHDVILEIATLVTDSNLNILAEGPELVLQAPESTLAGMDDWNTRHHTASGLVDKVRASTTTLSEAEQLTLAFVQQYTQERQAPLCGNTIGQDRRFLYKYMPALSTWLHYRSVDVSSIKELSQRWYPGEAFAKRPSMHRALDDIRQSVDELRYYRATIFRSQTPQ